MRLETSSLSPRGYSLTYFILECGTQWGKIILSKFMDRVKGFLLYMVTDRPVGKVHRGPSVTRKWAKKYSP